MISNNIAITGVRAAGMSWTLRAAAGYVPTAHHPITTMAARPAAAIPAQRKRRAATATPASVDRGTT